MCFVLSPKVQSDPDNISVEIIACSCVWKWQVSFHPWQPGAVMEKFDPNLDHWCEELCHCSEGHHRIWLGGIAATMSLLYWTVGIRNIDYEWRHGLWESMTSLRNLTLRVLCSVELRLRSHFHSKPPSLFVMSAPFPYKMLWASWALAYVAQGMSTWPHLYW